MKKLSKVINYTSLEQAIKDRENILKRGYKRIAIYSNCEVYQKVFCGNIECTTTLEIKI